MGDQRYDTWTHITSEKLLAYFGFMLLMGIVKLPSIDDYWKKDEALHYSMIAKRISSDRFREITRYLHFTDNTTIAAHGSDGYDR